MLDTGHGCARDFLVVADVDDGVTVARRRGERAEGHLEIGGCLAALDGRDAGARATAARGCARSANAARRERHQVKDQELAAQLSRQVKQELQGLDGLEASEDAGHGTEHARLGTVPDESIARRFGPQAAQARGVFVRAIDLQLALVLVHARKDRGLACQHTGIVQQKLGREIVAAIDGELVIVEEPTHVVGIQSHRVNANIDFGVERAQTACCELRFRLADVA
jgi:hypothetical protein